MVGSLENEFGEGVVSENVDELQNPKLIEKIRLQFSLKFKEINKQVSALSALFDNTSLRTVNEAIEEWDKAKEAFDKKYEAAKSRANVNQQQLKQIQDTERRIGDEKDPNGKSKHRLRFGRSGEGVRRATRAVE